MTIRCICEVGEAVVTSVVTEVLKIVSLPTLLCVQPHRNRYLQAKNKFKKKTNMNTFGGSLFFSRKVTLLLCVAILVITVHSDSTSW